MVRKQIRTLVQLSAALVLLSLPASLLAAEEEIYVVQKGDNLFRISQKHGITLDELLSYNPQIEDPNTVREGTRLKIPGTRETPDSREYTMHVIQAGENLYRLSLRYGVALDTLVAANGLSEDSILKVGYELKIPGRFPVSAADESVIREAASPESAAEAWKRGVPFWPHPGIAAPLEGKLYAKISPGVEITGVEGDRIVSVSSGTVEWASPYRGFGKVVMIKHHSGHNYVYGGIGELFVGVGDRVSVGTDLGLLGTHYHEGTAKVFFWVTKNGDFLEPQQAPRN